MTITIMVKYVNKTTRFYTNIMLILLFEDQLIGFRLAGATPKRLISQRIPKPRQDK